jgi:hypothetical protein
MQSFKINPHYGGGTVTIIGGVQHKKEEVVADITYTATGEDILTEQFKEKLNKAFAEFFQLAFTR